MATKPKTTESQAPAKDASLEAMFAKALGQFNEGKLKEALASFEALKEESVRRDEFHMGRAIEGYLRAIRARVEAQEAGAAPSVELAVQLKLNRRDAEGALADLEPALKASPDRAALHYLKAVALAQLDQAQPAADALTQASGIDPAVLFQFRLEGDFDGVRHSAPFQTFNRG